VGDAATLRGLGPDDTTAGVNLTTHIDYVYATRWGDAPSPFTPTYLRLTDDPEWTVHTPDAAHNLMRDIPDELVRICLSHA
jgi:hypothetical protein